MDGDIFVSVSERRKKKDEALNVAPPPALSHVAAVDRYTPHLRRTLPSGVYSSPFASDIVAA